MRDIDDYAEARAKKNVLTLSNTWVGSLMQQGYGSPLIKEVLADGSQMWFSQDGIDYVADLNGSGVTSVSKAKFSPPPKRTPAKHIDQPEVLTDESE